MNEDEFRGALRRTMAATSPPQPMSTADALVAGRRARFRRRVVSFCAGSATAVVLVAAVGFTGVLGSGSRYSPAGTKPSSSSTVDPRSRPSQVEWTAGKEQAQAMLNELIAVVPAGYTVVEDSLNPVAMVPMGSMGTAGRPTWMGDWVYQASFSIRQGKQTGLVLVEVHTGHSPLTRLQGDGCELTLQIYPSSRGQCQLVTVGQAKVGVAQSHWKNEDPPQFAQWAGYRHPDGAVVKVAQISSPDPYAHRFGVLPELKKLPFTVEQLAELAASDRFHVD
ncbi:hypothetical protein U2F26_20630 [Micromonospora sp. 4G57]|uniref:Uncharacterized protein n=1 Tax=Micromonospora sicca TaxID=2202420 RepID=A0ABU5JDV9_9ACTN|nr:MULTISPECIES: hypothetical protein [unclassified Micromonospora]MDZ5445115.1 hypothetical protein [Micromonospora sp. 4G57]MDZ5490766.1 hypothetical protein [Micromonospora sp. 4G53]